MPILAVQRNQLDYVGLYSRPAFAMWGNGQAVMEGMYDALQGFHSGLGDFRVLGDASNPTDQTVAVSVGARAEYRFKFDRIEATLYNFGRSDTETFPTMLDRGEAWLRESLPRFSFRSHLITYAAHAAVQEGAADGLLRALSSASIPVLGDDLGTGVIFHARHPEHGWVVQLSLDHSVLIDGGLYLQFQVLSTDDLLDARFALKTGRTLLEQALESVGVHLHDEGT
jgi:hypothetical protein